MPVPRALKKPLISLAVLLLALPVGELLVRLLTATHPPLVMRDADLGRRFVPSFSGAVFDAEAQRRVEVRTHADGFRGPERPYTPPPNTRRVAIVGDSMIAAVSVDEQDTLCTLLEQRLNAAFPALAWEVLNFGVLGASTGQECLIYEQVARRYSPDLVLCAFYSGNDLGDNSRALTSNPRIYFDLDESGALVQLPYSASRSAASRWLNLNSRLYVWQKQLVRRSRVPSLAAEPALRPSNWVFSSEPPEDVAHAWRITAALIGRLQDAVLADGAQFALVHVLSAQQVYGDSFQGILERAGEDAGSFERDHPDAKLQEICAELGLPYLSLSAGLRAAAPSDSFGVAGERLYWNSGVHWNERGNAVGAEALFAELAATDSRGSSLIERVAAGD